MVIQVGSFALTINNRDMLGYILNSSSLGMEKLNTLLKAKYRSAATANDYKKDILQVFKKIQEQKGIAKNAVNLYE